MSTQEILSWTSLATATAVLVFYLLIMFGWPNFLPDYSGQVFDLFFKVFWVAIIIEVIVDIMNRKDRVHKDERDFMIESYGVRYAYNFLMVAISIILVNIFLSGVLGDISEIHDFLGNKRITFHALFITLFTASFIKRTTMIYHYRTF